MNTAWAKEKLEGFISSYDDWRNSPAGNDHYAYLDAIRRTHTVIRIIETLGLEAPEASDVDDEYFLPRLGHVATTALGLLDDWDELDKNLRPTAPAIAADQLHPWVWDAARTFWGSKHYRAAVHQAALSINAHLQDKLDRRDISDDRLVGASFSDKEPDQANPRLRVPGDPTDQTVQSIQRGAGLFAMGCFQVIRNPAAHEHDDWPKHIALERLAALSVLARLVDESRVARWGVSELEQARKSFFERVVDRLGETYPAIGAPRTKTALWWSFAPGPFGYYATTFSRRGYFVEIYLDPNQKDSTKAVFDDLYDRRAEIAQRLGFELGWERLDDNRASRIACYYGGQLDPLTADTATLDTAARWSAARIQALHSTLDQELRSLAARFSSPPTEQA